MARARAPLLALAAGLSVGGAARAEPDRPYVEILEDLGAIDGPAEGRIGAPNWERVRLDLQLANRLPVEVRDVALEVRLVHATEEEAAIPGWTFPREVIEEAALEPTTETYVRLSLALPPRRSSPRAEEIAYRVRIVSYRVHPPDLETSLRLLSSSAPSDQRAALDSYALGADHPASAREGPAAELAVTLATLPPAPTAPDALRMLFAVRALGSLAAVEHVETLLTLTDRLDRAAWGRAVLELATRMVAASQPDEPRLFVLPSWARTKSALVKVRAEDAVEEAVRDALLRMGDAAVPELIVAAQTARSPSARALARRLLHALGRSTVRSQLALRDRRHRLRVLQAFGQVGAPDPVPALAEQLATRDARVRETARQALLQIGAPAVPALVDALGKAGDDPVFETLEVLAERHPAAVAEAAAGYGIRRRRDEPAASALARLRARLTEARKKNLGAELEAALARGRAGDYGAAIRRLDAVFEADREVYMARAEDIAGLYFSRARALSSRGDYDAAVEAARTGLSIVDAPRGRALLRAAQLDLVRGYTRLGDLEAADAVLAEIDRSEASEALREVEGALLVRKAADALERGDAGLARALVDRARMMGFETAELDETDTRLLFNENLAVILGMSLSVPVLLLVLALLVRQRWHRARMHRLTRALDDDGAPPNLTQGSG